MPTIKQKKAFERLGETGGVISKAMEGIYANPSKTEKLTQSNGWKELIEQFIPDKKLAKVLDEGLNSGKKNSETGEIEPDFSVRHKYLETGLKLKGHYTTDESDKPKQTNTTYNFIFSDEVQDKVKLINESIKSQLIKGNVQSD